VGGVAECLEIPVRQRNSAIGSAGSRADVAVEGAKKSTEEMVMCAVGCMSEGFLILRVAK